MMSHLHVSIAYVLFPFFIFVFQRRCTACGRQARPKEDGTFLVNCQSCSDHKISAYKIKRKRKEREKQIGADNNSSEE